jgi:hypothetical protein
VREAAQAAAVIGAIGCGGLLLLRARPGLLGALALVAVAEIVLAVSLVPDEDLGRLVDSPLRIVAAVLLVAVIAGLGVALARLPALIPVCLLVAAPFRVEATLGDQRAFLLLPLYGVLVASVVAIVVRSLSGAEPGAVHRLVAVPAAAFVGIASLSLLWSDDLRAGTIQLLFFLFPFVVLVAVVGRIAVEAWHARALGATVVVLGCVFAVVGLTQLWTHDLWFARDLEVANAYTSYTRTTSIFADPSIYARQLGLAIVVLVTALWLRRVSLPLAIGTTALLWTGLYFTYSQSTMVALVVAVLAISLIAADRFGRRIVAVGAIVIVLAALAGVLASSSDVSFNRLTSGRSSLVETSWNVFADHPVAGVGIGAQPEASREDGGRRRAARNASHATPLTVAAELGVIGLAAYVALLAGAAWLLLLVVRCSRALGLGLAACFLFLVVHSLFYSGFFEDPLTWGILAVAAAAVGVRSAKASDVAVEPGSRAGDSPTPIGPASAPS